MTENWVKEAHKELLEEQSEKCSMTYADMLNPDDIFDKKCERIKVTTIDGKVHHFTPNDIAELNGLSVKVKQSRVIIIIPLDKISYAEYLY